jgi:2-dehydropantoate 2-reductase
VTTIFANLVGSSAVSAITHTPASGPLALNKAEIETEVIADPMAQIWGKFVLNCAVNALSAVSGLRSGEIYRTPEMNALQDRIIDEILLVVERKDVRLPEANPRKKIKDHCQVRYNKPSMMQHVEQGRRTEIDSLNGAQEIRRALRHG